MPFLLNNQWTVLFRQTTSTHMAPFWVACKLSKTIDGTALLIHKLATLMSSFQPVYCKNQNGGLHPSKLRYQQQNPPFLGAETTTTTKNIRHKQKRRPFQQSICRIQLQAGTTMFVSREDRRLLSVWTMGGSKLLYFGTEPEWIRCFGSNLVFLLKSKPQSANRKKNCALDKHKLLTDMQRSTKIQVCDSTQIQNMQGICFYFPS